MSGRESSPRIAAYIDAYRERVQQVVEGQVDSGEIQIPFTVEEYQERLERVRQRMAQAGIDLLWVTMPEGMCYLHGYRARWYRVNSPMDWPPLTATAVHVDHDQVIHFDNWEERYLLKRTSIADDVRFYPASIPIRPLRWRIR